MTLRTLTARNGIAMAVAFMVHAWFFYLFAGELRIGRRVFDRAELFTRPIFIQPTSRESAKSSSRQATSRPRSAASEAVSADRDTKADSSTALDIGVGTPAAIDLDATKTAAILAMLERERIAQQSAFTDRNTKPFIPMPPPIDRSSVPWDPLRGRSVGLTDEGLFFVRLSDKCLIVMTFVVCQFGGNIK